MDGMREKRQRLESSVLEGLGVTDPAQRRAAAEDAGLDGALAAYIDKVHRQAYRITDEDVAVVKAAGYTDDAIFELTVAAALGAARRRLEAGLRAIEAAER